MPWRKKKSEKTNDMAKQNFLELGPAKKTYETVCEECTHSYEVWAPCKIYVGKDLKRECK